MFDITAVRKTQIKTKSKYRDTLTRMAEIKHRGNKYEMLVRTWKNRITRWWPVGLWTLPFGDFSKHEPCSYDMTWSWRFWPFVPGNRCLCSRKNLRMDIYRSFIRNSQNRMQLRSFSERLSRLRGTRTVQYSSAVARGQRLLPAGARSSLQGTMGHAWGPS